MSLLVLSGCTFVTNKIEQQTFESPFSQSERVSVSYDFSSDSSEKYHREDYSCDGIAGVRSCLSNLPENSHFFKTEKNPEFTLETKVSLKVKLGSGTEYLSILTLGLIPGEEAEYIYMFEPKIINNKTGREITLSKSKIVISKWWGWFVVPFGSISSTGSMQVAIDKLMPNIYNEMASMIYNKKSKLYTGGVCATTKCRIKEILQKEHVSGEELKFISENSKTLEEFQKAKSKLSGTYNSCAVSLGVLTNKNKIISKNNKKYWALVDYYKNECEETRLEKFRQGDEIGMSKSQLLEKKGVPTKAYKPNSDTEMLTFSKVYGESIMTKTYILDHGIITSIK